MPAEPASEVGSDCDQPFSCGFYGHCSSNSPKVQYQVDWVPHFSAKPRRLAEEGVMELMDVPDDLLSEKQKRVKSQVSFR